MLFYSVSVADAMIRRIIIASELKRDICFRIFRNKDCTWDITTTDSNANVILKILFMDIENEASCGYDYIAITESGMCLIILLKTRT